MPNNLTDEQIKDIQEREAAALEFLKKSELSPAAFLSVVNIGDDVFATKVQAYLADTKYTKKAEEPKVVEAEIVSPITKDDLEKKD